MQHETSKNAVIEKALEHAWNWFSLHAAHRMQSVNFFLVAVAFLSAAFVTALQIPNHFIAGAVAALGVFVSTFFNRLELRIQELIHAGELPAFRLRKGGHWRLTRGELEEWLEKRREQGAG